MKLLELRAADVIPIKLAHIQNMTDVVVLAGPNGVGKTRLIATLLQNIQNLATNQNFFIRVEATCRPEQKAWGKPVLDTRIQADVELLKATIQKNRRRSKFSSSFLNFESNRTITQVKNFNWDWNFGDPFEEELSWNFGNPRLMKGTNDLIAGAGSFPGRYCYPPSLVRPRMSVARRLLVSGER